MHVFISSIRIILATMLICVVGYSGLLLGIGQLFFRQSAEGSLLLNRDGIVVGSRQVAQAFSSPGYFWSRPSAVAYDGAGAGGSNLGPASPQLRERANATIASFGAIVANPLPADLATASGSGLDPHISLAAARFQVPRVAAARNMEADAISGLIEDMAQFPGGFLTGEAIINVLELNLALDALNQAN
jgi:K+-transporting ATPase ATPase C chain